MPVPVPSNMPALRPGRRQSLLYFVIGFTLLIAFAIGGMAVSRSQAADKPNDPAAAEALVSSVTKSMKLHNYNGAMKDAEKGLKLNPNADQKRVFEAALGIGKIRTGDRQNGLLILNKLIESDPVAKQDADIANAIVAAVIAQYADGPTVTQAVERALTLAKANGDTKLEFELLFQLGDYLRSQNPYFPSEGNNNSWYRRRVECSARAIRTYQRILDMSPPEKRTIRALVAQSQAYQEISQFEDHFGGEEHKKLVAKFPELVEPTEKAIACERSIIAKFGASGAAGEAYLRIAQIEERRAHYLAALSVLEELQKALPNSAATKRGAAMVESIKAPRLSLQIQGVTLPDTAPKYRWGARNLEKISLAAYPIDLFERLPKVDNIYDASQEAIDPALKPVATWTVNTGDKKDHVPTDSKEEVEMPKLPADAYVVVAEGTTPEGKKTRAQLLLVVSRLAAISKSAGDSRAYFVVDALTGKPEPQTEILLQHYEGTFEVPILRIRKQKFSYETKPLPDNGLLLLDHKQDPNHGHHQTIAIACKGSDYALINQQPTYWWNWWQTSGYRGYTYTDRPVYRPSQTVQFKSILRKVVDGGYAIPPNSKVKVLIYDARGETIYDKEQLTDDEGTISGSLTLGEEPPLGQYRIALNFNNESTDQSPGSVFRVEEYKKPEFEVTVSAKEPFLKVGQRVQASVHGEYYFGGAVAKAKVQYQIYRQPYYFEPIWPRPFHWLYTDDDFGFSRGRGYSPRLGYVSHQRDLVKSGTVVTDEFGNALITFPTESFPNLPGVDLQYQITAKMVDESRREIEGSTSIKVTTQAFYLTAKPQVSLYQPGDTARIDIQSRNPNGAPVATRAKVTLSYVTQREVKDSSGKVTKAEAVDKLAEKTLDIPKEGRTEYNFVPEKQGYYRLDFTAADPFGGKIESTTYLWVAKGTGELAHVAHSGIELVVAKDTVPVGDSLDVLVTSKYSDAYVLLTAESDGLYWSKVEYMPKNSLQFTLPVTKAFQPNITLTATLVRDNQMFTEKEEIRVPPVDEFLTVKLIAPKQEFRPREKATIEVEIADHKGNPVEADLSLGVMDASVLYIQSETRGDIRAYFYGRQRPYNVRTTSSWAFHSHGRDGLPENDSGDAWWNQIQASRAAGVTAFDEAAPAAPMAAAELSDGRQLAKSAPNRAAKKEKADADAFAETEIRSEFPDTVFWAANLRTSADGKAKVDITFPDSLTTWRLTSIAVNAKSQVGEIHTEVQTRKNVLVRLQAPRFFIETDEVWLSAIAHNYLDQPKKVRVSMQSTAELQLVGIAADGVGEQSVSSGQPYLDVEIPAGGEKRVDFHAKVLRPGNVTLVAKAQTDVESDAMQLKLPVIEYGTDKLLAQSGIILGGESDQSISIPIEIPTAIRSGSQEITVEVSPTVAGVMLESLPYLLDYPYGCTEQTMSRFLPAVLTQRTLRILGINLSDIAKMPKADPVLDKRLRDLNKNPVFDEKKMGQMIDAGVKRLADFQLSDGGWGWWKNDSSNPYISAYVVSGLVVAEESGVKLPDGMLKRGVTFLKSKAAQPEAISRYPWQAAEDKSVRVYMLYAIGTAEPKALRQKNLAAQLREAFEQRDELSDYSRALLALALNTADMREEARIVASNIIDRAVVDERTETCHWGEARNYWYWYNCGNEATAYSMRALLKIKPGDPHIPQAVTWLMRQRQGTRWFNTKDTAIVCYALADYLIATDELDPDMTITLNIDSKVSRTMKVTRENMFTFDKELKLAADQLGTGTKTVSISKRGRGNLYWGAYATFFTKEEKIEPAGNDLFVKRSYVRLTEKNVIRTERIFDVKTSKWIETPVQRTEYDEHPLQDGDAVESGDLIEVRLSIESLNNFEYVMIEDPKPAGFEATELKSGYSWGNGLGGHQEFRDEKVAFFVTYLNKGKYDVKYRLRAEIPGLFHALPTHGECMYAPRVKGNSASNVLRINFEQK